MATKPPRLYVPLDALYADDEKIIGLSVPTELLWIRVICEAKKRPNQNGFLSELDLKYAAGSKLKSLKMRASELVDAGLLEPAQWHGRPGWRIKSWAAWNMTDSEADKRRRDRMMGGYIKAHREGRHRGTPVPGCPKCGATSTAPSSATSSGTSTAPTSAKEKEKTKSSTSTTPLPPYGAGAPTGDGGLGPDPERPHYPEDWNDGRFMPTDYHLDETQPHLGGWAGTAWIQPAEWRPGWSGTGRRPRRDTAGGEAA